MRDSARASGFSFGVMQVTFIKPNMGLVDGRPYRDAGRMEPLTFAVLAGQLPADVTCVLHDDRCEPIPYDLPTDLVAINVEIYTARRAYEIAAAYRRRGVPVALGGCHVSLAPDEAAAHADAILIGDAEGSWPALVADAAAGRLHPVYHGAHPPDLHGVRTRWDLFAGKRYLPIRLTQFSRGCTHACAYCATASLYRQAHPLRPAEEVVDELRGQPALPIFFVDDNIVAEPEAAKELFRLLIPLKRRWFSQASLEFVQDAELMDLMRRSGCAGLVVGFESLHRDDLLHMGKTCNLQFADYAEPLHRMRAMGLMLWAAFLLGYDHDDADSIRHTVAWAIEQRFCFAAFNILTPYPTTPLYAQLEAEGRLLYPRWWLHPAYRFGDAVFHPARLSADALTEACFRARRHFNSPPSIARRLADRRTNAKDLWSLATYCTYNPLFRRETFKKHGMRLGYENALPEPAREEAPCPA